jgi:plasmid stabilization system protein ParE
MVEKKFEVVWTKRSEHHMKKAYDYIKKDSLQNAVKVLEDIVKAVNKATSNPEFYGLDKYKHNNDGSYRTFEKHHYRIAYRFGKNVIRVLRYATQAWNQKGIDRPKIKVGSPFLQAYPLSSVCSAKPPGFAALFYRLRR